MLSAAGIAEATQTLKDTMAAVDKKVYAAQWLCADVAAAAARWCGGDRFSGGKDADLFIFFYLYGRINRKHSANYRY